jgi:hypothetical protein
MRRRTSRGRGIASLLTARRARLGLSAVLLAVLAALVCAPVPASALGFDCKDAPAPEIPGRGLTGFFAGEPKTLAPPGDPFAANPTTTIYEQYGYAGLRWNNYDLGCGPDATRAPDAVAGTAIANWMFNLPKVAVAFTSSVVAVAFDPSFFAVFDPVVSDVTQALYTNVFAAWLPLTLAATGFLLIWRARRANFASSTAAVGWALLVLIVATALFRWPVQAGSSADASMTSVLGSVSRSVGGQPTGATGPASTAAATHEALLYNAWLAGTFGNADSATAKRYGPAIFDASALTWREARTLRDDPAAGKKIVEAKKQKFTDTAERIKSADPDAYEYLIGKRSDARVGYALLAAFGAFCALPFLFGAALLVLASFLIVRISVMIFPAVATLGVFPAMRQVVTGIFSMVAGALVNALLFGVAAAVALRGIGLLLAPGAPLPQWLAITLLLLFTGVLWVALRPVRRLAMMVGADVGFSRGRSALLRHLGIRRPAGAVAESDDDAGPEERPDRAVLPARAEAHSLPYAAPARTSAGLRPGSPAGVGGLTATAGRPGGAARAGVGASAAGPKGPGAFVPAGAVPDPPAGHGHGRRNVGPGSLPLETFAATAAAASVPGIRTGNGPGNGSGNGSGNPVPARAGAPIRWAAARPEAVSAPAVDRPTDVRVAAPRSRTVTEDGGRLYLPASTTSPGASASVPPPAEGLGDAGDLADLSGIYRPGGADVDAEPSGAER